MELFSDRGRDPSIPIPLLESTLQHLLHIQIESRILVAIIESDQGLIMGGRSCGKKRMLK